jgi:hypothetical protein
MKGPGFFATNADMSVRRPEISALARTEAWREMPVPDHIPPPTGLGPRRDRLLRWLLNGHLLPFFRFFGREVVIASEHRGLIWPLWGARQARFVDLSGTRSYVVSHSKRRFVRSAWRALGLTWRWLRAYPALRDAHRRGYGDLTSRRFWTGQFAAVDEVAAD